MHIALVRMIKSRAILLSLLAAVCIAPCAMAKLTADELKSAIDKSGVFDAQTKFTVALDGAGVSISTYKDQRSTEQDCKIDAVLASKAAMSADPTIAHATVLFYDARNLGDFYEVPVSLGDVIAYGKGEISKDQLLAAIQLTKHVAHATQVAPLSTDDQGGSKETAMAAPAEHHAAAQEIRQAIAPVPNPTAAPSTGNTNTYANYGISFNYPKAWRLQYPGTGNTLVQFYMPSESIQVGIVEVRVYSRKSITPAEVIQSDPDDMFSPVWHAAWRQGIVDSLPKALAQFIPSHSEAEEQEQQWHSWKEEYYQRTGHHYHRSNYQPVNIPESIRCGIGKSVHCWQRAYYATPGANTYESRMGPTPEQAAQFSAYMQCVAFATGPYVIQLDLLCPYKDAYNDCLQFNKVLETLRAAGAKDTDGQANRKPAAKRS